MKRIISVILIISCMILGGCGTSSDIADNTLPNTAEGTYDFFESVKKSTSAYINKEHGISFVLPGGWNVSDTNDENGTLLITADSVGIPIMLYTSVDLFSREFEDEGTVSRSVLDNELLLIGDFTESMGIDSSKIERIEYNGTEYFQAEVDDYSDGMENAVVWYRLDHGWFDTFVFGSNRDNEFFAAFEKIVASATYDRDYEEKEAENADETVNEFDYLPAEWSDELFRRNGCSGYPLILNTPIEMCKGFTVDYTVNNVTDGNMKSDAKFQVFYQISDGTWIKGTTFTLDDGAASVEQRLDEAKTVTQVIVICLNAGNFSWSESMGIRNPIY